MVDFIKAFQTGLEAAKEAEANKKEIMSVISEVSSQLKEASGGKLKIRIGLFAEDSGIPQLLMYPDKRKKYYAICAEQVTEDKSGTSSEIAKWKLDRHGYPCSIEFGDRVLLSEDKESLEENLQTLLADPMTGDKLLKLINES